MTVGVVRAEPGAGLQRRLECTPDEPELQIGAPRRVAHVGERERLGAERRRQITEPPSDPRQPLPKRRGRDPQDPADLLGTEAVQREHRDPPAGRGQLREQGLRLARLTRRRFVTCLVNGRDRGLAAAPTPGAPRAKGGLIAHHAFEPGRIEAPRFDRGHQDVLDEVVGVLRAARVSAGSRPQPAVLLDVHAVILEALHGTVTTTRPGESPPVAKMPG